MSYLECFRLQIYQIIYIWKKLRIFIFTKRVKKRG
nr:MAG TPA: hypothetical protein [Caudoviricetes sp.]